MQCVLIVVAALFVLAVPAQAQSVPIAQYAGNTTGGIGPSGGQFAPPSFATSGGACSTAAFQADYQKFTLTITTPTVYNFQVLTEQTFKSSCLVVLYSTTFTTTTPCAGLVGGKPLGDQLKKSGGPIVNDFLFLAAGTYIGVITGKSATGSGLFAVSVFKSNQTGSTFGSSTQWNYVSSSSQGATCSSSSSTANYSVATWTPAVTAGYDIGIFFYNATYSESTSGTWYTSAAVFRGANPLNTSTIADPCLTSLDAQRVVAYSNNAFGLFIRNVTLTAGQLYTIIFSGQDLDQVGQWGVDVFPSILHTTLGSSPTNYIPPDRTTAPPCDPASNAQLYYVYTFTVPVGPMYYTYIFDTQEAFSSFDTFSYLYSGLNNAATGPSSCNGFLYGGDTGDQRPVAYGPLTPGQDYTLIVTNYNQAANTGGTFALYVMTGTQLGPFSVIGTSTGLVEPSSAVPVTVSLASMVIILLSLLFTVM